MMKPTHAQLVAKAVQWLRAKLKCGVVLSELVTAAPCMHDVVGWYLNGAVSILIECKTSRADFKRDQKKWHRRCYDIGQSRYFFAIEGLISPSELPPGWGLLEMKNGKIKVTRRALPLEVSRQQEAGLLYSALRRKRPHKSIHVKEYK